MKKYERNPSLKKGGKHDMILTKKQITTILQSLPSEKSAQCSPIQSEIRVRLKDELNQITEMEKNGDDLFTQYMKRVGHTSTKDYEFQYVEDTNGTVVIRKATNLICATVSENMIHTISKKDEASHIPNFTTCCTCGMPMQEGYLSSTKDKDQCKCELCFSTQMNTLYGKGNWQFTEKIKMGDDDICTD